MGCSSSKENDQTASGRREDGQAYAEQAEDAASMLSSTGRLYTRLQLSIACKGLVNLDRGGKSDPFVVVKLLTPSASTESVELGRTEIISNNLDPQFVTIICVVFNFEEIQYLRFEVYDVDTAFTSADSSGLDPSQQEFQGAAECTLAHIVNLPGQSWEGDLVGGPKAKSQKETSKVIVRAEEAADSNALVTITLGALNVRNASKCFLRISRTLETGPPVPCFKTEVVSNPSALWAPIELSIQILANGDLYRPLLLEVFNWKKSGSHTLLGTCKASVNGIKPKTNGGLLTLDSDAGSLFVSACTVIPQPSFFDYLAGGMQIGFTVALDYTASNGDPNNPASLHFHDPSGQNKNEYDRAIQAVGEVLEFFDADRRFPVYGFGGKPHGERATNHCFPVNGNEHYPEAVGIAGVLDAYRDSLAHVVLSGPTLFAPVIRQTAAAAKTWGERASHQNYTILLLITDGVICDMENTVDAIVEAADCPFSIVIVGVGMADYSSMSELDGDDVRLVDSQGKTASRDIVQFVSMQDFADKDPRLLAKEVLCEIPGQVVEYMKMKKIVPAAGNKLGLQKSVIEGMQKKNPVLGVVDDPRASNPSTPISPMLQVWCVKYLQEYVCACLN